jgi:Mg2+/citrate symporter
MNTNEIQMAIATAAINAVLKVNGHGATLYHLMTNAVIKTLKEMGVDNNDELRRFAMNYALNRAQKSSATMIGLTPSELRTLKKLMGE